MFGKKVKSRTYFLAIIILLTALGLFIFFKSLEKNIVYFFSPTEIYNNDSINFKKEIRIGGMVKLNSLKINKNSINFVITDYNNEIHVVYSGPIPNLFSEGKGAVVEGKLNDKKFFLAKKILAKHDENYMPPEIAEVLQKSGE